MAVEPPSWHAVPSWGRCGRGVVATLLGGVGGHSLENFRIFEAPGCILGHTTAKHGAKQHV